MELKEIISSRARKNQLSTLKQNTVSQNSDKRIEIKPVDTQKELAKAAGVSHDTIHKVEVIETKAPEHVKELTDHQNCGNLEIIAVLFRCEIILAGQK